MADSKRASEAEMNAWENLDADLDREEQLREPEMTDQEWTALVDKLDRQYETPQRSEWYRETQAEHAQDLAAPQRFPLTGDGLVTQRIIADGPFNGPDIGEELALARYRDWEFSAKGERQMPDVEADRQADAYWDNLVSRARQTEQNAQAYAVTQRQAAPERPETEIVERAPRLSL